MSFKGGKKCAYDPNLRNLERSVLQKAVKAACVLEQTRTSQVPHLVFNESSKVSSQTQTLPRHYLTTGLHGLDFLSMCLFQLVKASRH